MSVYVVPKELVVWGSECLRCGNATADSQRCDLCGQTDRTVPLWIDATVRR